MAVSKWPTEDIYFCVVDAAETEENIVLLIKIPLVLHKSSPVKSDVYKLSVAMLRS